jgi:hypothetical protein
MSAFDGARRNQRRAHLYRQPLLSAPVHVDNVSDNVFDNADHEHGGQHIYVHDNSSPARPIV